MLVGGALLAICFSLFLLTGCQSAPTLPTEDRVADFAAIKSKAASVEMLTNRVSLEATRNHPFEIALHENASTPHDRAIVFIHGVFSDSRMWRYLCWDLAPDYNVIAFDLLGCGESDRPDPDDVGPTGYSPAALGRDCLYALRQRLAHLPHNTHLTLVGHSLGAMTILNMWADSATRAEYADVLDRVDSIVLLSAPDITSNCRRKVFEEIDKMDDVRMAFADVFGILKRRVTLATIDGVADPNLATREEAQRVIDILRQRSTRRAGQAMLRQAIPRSNEIKEQIVSGYANVKPPCLIIWGAQDDVFPTEMGYKLADRLPDAQLRIINSAMHGIATERPAVCANLLRDFVSAKHASAPRIIILDVHPSAQHDPAVSAIASPTK